MLNSLRRPSHSMRRLRLAAIVAGCLLSTSVASAANVTWDITPGNGTVEGGTGTWNTSNTLWTTTAGASNTSWVNGNNDTAIFSGTAGTVTTGEAITIGGLDFQTTGYMLAGSTTNVINLGLATTTVNAGTGVSATISGVLAGDATKTLNITGPGTINITNNANTFLGNIIVDGGTLRVAGDNGAGGDPLRLGPSTAAKNITLQNGGTYVSITTTTNPTGTNPKRWVIGTGGGTIQTDSTMTLDDAGQFSGTGDLTKTGTGILNIKTQGFTYTGSNVNVNAGEIEINNAGSLGTGALTIKVASGAMFDAQATMTGTKSLELNGSGISNRGALANESATATASFTGTVTLMGNTSIGGAGTINLSGVVSDGVNAFTLTKVGTGNTTVSNASNAWDGATTVSGGTLNFGVATALPSTTNITLAASTGVGFGYVFDQAFLASRVTNTAGGAILIGANNSNSLDLNTLGYGANARIGGMAGTTATYTGTLTPVGSATADYKLGGPGTLTLSNANALTGSRNLEVANAGMTSGTIVLSANNNFTGTTTIDGMTLSIPTIQNGGVDSPIGNSSSAINLLNGGTLLYSAATAGSTNRTLALGTGGGGINVSNAAATLTLPSASGGTPFTKAGSGTLTMSGAVTASSLTQSAGTLNLNGSSTFSAGLAISAGTLNLNAATTFAGGLTSTGGTLNVNTSTSFPTASTFTGTSTINIPTGQTLTFGNSLIVGADNNAALTLTGGGSLVNNSPSTEFILGNRTSGTTALTASLNASALSNVTINASNITIGKGTTSVGIPGATLTLPSGATSTATLTTPAAGTIQIGGASVNGQTNPISFLRLGGGTNTLTTGTVNVGGLKTGASLDFAGTGGDLSLTHPTAGSKVTLTVGYNPTGTASTPISVANLTTTGAVNMTLGNLNLVVVNRDNLNTTTGTFTLNAGSGLVTADAVRLGDASTGTTSTNAMGMVGNFNLAGGTFQFNAGGTGFVIAPTAGATHNRTLNMAVSGGTLNMSGKPIALVSTGTGTTSLTLSGTGLINMQGGDIGNLTSLTFTGGTLRNVATLARALTQSNTTASSFEVTANDATISGAYTLNGGDATIAAGRTLNVPLGMILNGGNLGGGAATPATIVGNVTATSGSIAPGSSPGTLAITGDLSLAAAMNLSYELGAPGTIGSGINDLITVSNNLTLDGTLNVAALPGFGAGTYTLMTYAGTFLDNGLNVVLPVGYTGTVDTSTLGQVNLQVVSAIPEPSTLVVGAVGVLGLALLRRRKKS